MRASRRRALGAVALGLASALFFTTTYVLNRAMADAGGHWAWSAALRYLLTLPLLALVMPWLGGVRPVFAALRAHPGPWLLWSVIGFGLFFCGLTFAAGYVPSWLVAGTFQLTVIAGPLMGPLLYRDHRARLPRAALVLGLLIVIGVALMQAGVARGWPERGGWFALLAVAMAAVCYPLGNRGLLLHLERSGIDLNASQRVFGMTLASQPFFLLVAAWGAWASGPPASGQVLMSAGVALFAGIIATILFFSATGRVQDDPAALGAVEAMQAGELLFSALLGVAFLGEAWPGGPASAGALLVMAGIAGMGWLVGRRSAGDARAARVLRSGRGA